MADQSLNVDGYPPAATTASSKWLELSLAVTDFARGTADVSGATAWLQAQMACEERATINFWTVAASDWERTFYKMRGMDALTDGLYDTWLAESEPDLDASEYAGALNLPLRDVIVIDSWSA